MDQLQSGAWVFRTKPLSQPAQTDTSISEGLGTMKYSRMTSAFTYPALVSTGNAHNRKLNTKWRELCWALPGSHHLPPFWITNPPRSAGVQKQLSAQKYTIKHGIKWEQPQTFPRKPRTKLIPKVLVPPAFIPTPLQISVQTSWEMWIKTLGAISARPQATAQTPAAQLHNQPSPPSLHFHPNPSP